MLKSPGNLKFTKNKLLKTELDEKPKNSFNEDIFVLKKFLEHVYSVDLTMESGEMIQFEKIILEKYLRIGVLSNTFDQKSAENLTENALTLSKTLNTKFSLIEEFKTKIDETIRSACLAESLAKGRKILRSKKCLTDSILPNSDETLLSVTDESCQLSESLQTSLSLRFQSPAVISQQCAELWRLCLADKKAAGCLADMYSVFIPKTHDLVNDLSSFAVFYNDIEWLIGGLTRLSLEDDMEKSDKFQIFKVQNKLETILEKISIKHIKRLQVGLFSYFLTFCNSKTFHLFFL